MQIRLFLLPIFLGVIRIPRWKKGNFFQSGFFDEIEMIFSFSDDNRAKPATHTHRIYARTDGNH